MFGRADLPCGGLEGRLSDLRCSKWQKLCEEALLEPDPEKLFLRVIVAETAIFHRSRDPASSPDNIELETMDRMLKSLQRLVANSFVLPDSEERDAPGAPQIQANASRLSRAKRQTQPSA